MNQIFTQQVKARPALVGRKQLAELTGVRASTLKFYSEIGLLPYRQAEGGLARRYDRQEATQRLGEIKQLQQAGLSINDIQQRLCD